MKINKLPGNHGSYISQTEKRTRMYRYQINGTDEEKALYVQAKEAEGYDAIVNPEYGLLYLTALNLGREAELDVYPNADGVLKISGYNEDLTAIEELRSAGVSRELIDQKIIEALNKGKFATKIAVPKTAE